MGVSNMGLEEAILACWSIDEDLEFLTEAVLERSMPAAKAGEILSGIAELAEAKFAKLSEVAERERPTVAEAIEPCRALIPDLRTIARSCAGMSPDEISNALIGTCGVHGLRFNELWALFEQTFPARPPSP